MNKFYTTNWPENITIDSTWSCDLGKDKAKGNGVRFTTCFDGSKTEFDTVIDKYVKHAKLAEQLKRRSLPESTTRFLHETLVAQWSEEMQRAIPTSKKYYIYSSFVLRNDRRTIELITLLLCDKFRAFRELFPGEKGEFLATFIHCGGKMGQAVDSAYFWREAVYHMYLTVEWEDKWLERDMRGFLYATKRAMRPFSLQGEAAFVNFPDGAFPAEVHERAYWGNNREELRRIKQIWDKDNFFKSRQGVLLPTGRPEVTPDWNKLPSDETLTDTFATQQWEMYASKRSIIEDRKWLTDLGL
jgi:hypothetical protein